EDRGRHLPRVARRRRRPPRRTPRRCRAGRALARRPRPAGRGRRRAAGRLLLRRLPACRRHRALRPGDDRGRRGRAPRPAGPRHLQRLPGAVRGAPAAGGVGPQRAADVRLQGPAAARREQPDRVDLGVRRGRGGHDRAQERRGRVRRGLRHPRPAGGRGPGGGALPRRQPQRLAARHRRDRQRARQRRRVDAAPGARGGGAVRCRHRRARVLHLRAAGARRRL
ncbi:MAG: Phosphoribosylformylglycinamidine synthase, glutamine amidotransferase subunit, partial [uncultured Nocardioidaceae bacterium]